MGADFEYTSVLVVNEMFTSNYCLFLSKIFKRFKIPNQRCLIGCCMQIVPYVQYMVLD